jgi:hypothetical protein
LALIGRRLGLPVARRITFGIGVRPRFIGMAALLLRRRPHSAPHSETNTF